MIEGVLASPCSYKPQAPVPLTHTTHMLMLSPRQAFIRVIQAHPIVLLLPLLLLLASVGLGLLGVLLSARAYEKQEKEGALAWASTLANDITQALEVGWL